MEETTCCFFGHREIGDADELRKQVIKVVEGLIVNEQIDTFLFGSGSKFNSLCYEVVSCLKDKYPHIMRVYVRAEYPYITDAYKASLLTHYEDTYFPAGMERAGRAAYVERNQYMIDHSSVCVIYYREDYQPRACRTSRSVVARQRNSGTQIARAYAVKQGRRIIHL